MVDSPIENMLSRLQGVKKLSSGWVARCPAHDDEHASLSIDEGDDGRVLLHCHAGCEPEAVARALNLRMADLFKGNADSIDKSAPPSNRRREVAYYDYTDEKGELLYQVVRYEPKDFRQRAPDGRGGWKWSLNGVKRVLYRLPRVLDAVLRGQTVFVVEGEKDVHALEALGLVATTNAGGAGKWTKACSAALVGAGCVVIIPDNDEPGKKHAAMVAASLKDAGVASVKVLGLPGLTAKGDVSDWLRSGHTVEELARLADAAEEWKPEPEAFTPVYLEDIPEHNTRWVLPGLLAEGGVTVIAGEPGAGKTTLAAELAWCVGSGEKHWLGTPQPGVVLWLGFDDPASRIRSEKLELLGDLPERTFVTLNEPLPLSEVTLSSYVKLVSDTGARLVVVDTLLDFLAMPDYDKSGPMQQGMKLVRQLAQRSGACVLATAHTSKDATRQGVARVANSTLLTAKADLVALLKGDAFDNSSCLLQVCKDRLGAGNWSQRLRRVHGRTEPVEPVARPLTTAEKIIIALERNGGSLARETLLPLVDGVTERMVNKAIRQLRKEGVIDVSYGDGRRATYTLRIPNGSFGSLGSSPDQKNSKAVPHRVPHGSSPGPSREATVRNCQELSKEPCDGDSELVRNLRNQGNYTYTLDDKLFDELDEKTVFSETLPAKGFMEKVWESAQSSPPLSVENKPQDPVKPDPEDDGDPFADDFDPFADDGESKGSSSWENAADSVPVELNSLPLGDPRPELPDSPLWTRLLATVPLEMARKLHRFRSRGARIVHDTFGYSVVRGYDSELWASDAEFNADFDATMFGDDSTSKRAHSPLWNALDDLGSEPETEGDAMNHQVA